ncbi:unnamed protein product [Rotaria sp. Silwood2]|nr:unnamed protein product [Rotaria sp. Silwood2]CAF4457580.1 unnamed protein product [Rotaria sp. Silwood2]
MRSGVLADVAKSFVKDYLQSGLRTVCTPYMHLVGTHLAEQDKYENLPSYDMQGVEKCNDLLSCLYFSSSNRAKKPLRTMVQTLYRRLEMNFSDPKDREVMSRYARTGVMNEADSEEDDDIDTKSLSSVNQDESLDCSSNSTDSEEEKSNENDEEETDAPPDFMSQYTFQVKKRENRWKSFKRKD